MLALCTAAMLVKAPGMADDKGKLGVEDGRKIEIPHVLDRNPPLEFVLLQLGQDAPGPACSCATFRHGNDGAGKWSVSRA